MKVSVLLTTYNRAEVLRIAIASLLSQTYKDFELVIADDGSTDNTEEVVKSFNDKRIVYKKFKHMMTYKLRNNALRLCKGKYIVPVDDDDVNLPNKLKLLVEALDKNPKAGCAYASWREINEKSRDIITKPFSIPRLIWGECMVHANTMLRRKWLEKHSYKIEYDFAGDYIFFLEIARAGCKFVNVPEVTYIYYRHDKGISKANSKDRVLLCKFYIQKFLESLSLQQRRDYEKETREIRLEKYSPKISVLVPYYVSKKQLYKTLRRIKEQGDFEIIVANDGSKHPNIKDVKYYWQSHKGFRLASVRNACMKLSTGDILVFLDAEIYPEQGFFDKIKRCHYDNNNLLLIHGVYDENGDEYRRYNERMEWAKMGGGSCSIRKFNALKIGLFDENFNGGYGVEDTDWGYRAHQKGIKIEHNKNIKTYHQRHLSILSDKNRNREYFKQKHNIEL